MIEKEIYQYECSVPYNKTHPPENLITFTHEDVIHYAEIIERIRISASETEIRAKKLTYEEFIKKWDAAIFYTI